MAPVDFSPVQVVKAFALWILVFVFLPLSPLYMIATLVYQLGCVHGKLSPPSRVATFVICVFLATAWIPFLTLYYYTIGAPQGSIQCLTQNSIESGGKEYRTYSIDWRDYATEYRNDQGVQIDTVLPMGTLFCFYLYGTIVALRVYSIDDSYEEEKDRAVVEQLRVHPLEPPIRFTSARTGAATTLSNAYEMYMALRNENPDNATVVAVGVGTLLAAVVTTAARLVQDATADQAGKPTCARPGENVSVPAWFDPATSTHYAAINGTAGLEIFREGPTYTLSTVYFCGMFLVFFSTFAFVATLYVNHVRIVWQLTFFAGGDTSRASKSTSNSLRTGLAQTLAMLRPPGGDDDNESLLPDSPMRAPPPPPQRHTLATDTASRWTLPGSNTFRDGDNDFNHHLSVGGSIRFSARHESLPSNVDGGRYTCNSMQPYNIMHLRAWDEVRQVAATYISAPSSTLNAFLTPTMWFAVFALGGSFMYLIVTFFISFKTIGPFSVTMILFLLVFAIFFVIVSGIAKIARKHFKFHNVIVARIAFDVACEIDARTPLVQQGIESVEERRPGMEHLELGQLVEMHESTLGLLSFMEATSPKPLILGVEHRHVKYGLAYFLLVSANLLFIALLNASNTGKCFDDD